MKNGINGEMIFFIVIIAIVFLVAVLYYLEGLIVKANIKRRVRKIKAKNDPNLYEILFLESNNEKVKNLIAQKFPSFSKKNYDFELENKGKGVIFSYSYKHFDVSIKINEDSLGYCINFPTSFQEHNYSYKRRFKAVGFLINDYSTLESFLERLSDEILIIDREIDEYIKCNKVHPIFNGRLFDKIRIFENKVKNRRISSAILAVICLFMSIFFILGSNFATEEETELIVFIASIGISLFFLICFVMFIIDLINFAKIYNNVQKDLQNQEVEKINEKIIKAKLVLLSSYNDCKKRLLAVKLFYKSIKLIIPLNNQVFDKRKSRKIIEGKIVDTNCELVYLPNSKLVVDGDVKILKLLR